MKLELTDGTIIDNLRRINKYVYEVEGAPSSLYFQLSNTNLAFATLYNDEGDIEEMFVNCYRQNYFNNNGIVQFRIGEGVVE